MNWKEYSIFHVLRKRWNCQFTSKTAMDFYSGICRTDNLSKSSLLVASCMSIVISLIFGLSFWQFIALDVALDVVLAAIFSAVDTYYMRKIQIRRETMKSIELMIGMVDRKRWP